MQLIGLTGGIATGKSTMSRFFTYHNVKVVDADVIAREVVQPGEVCNFKILDTFGPSVFSPTGQVDRERLGSVVFQNPEYRHTLNRLTHPYIRFEMILQILRHFLHGETKCIIDTPLLFETGMAKWVHRVIVVYCPRGQQKERLMLRDGLSAEQAQNRLNSQIPIEKKKSMADHVIDNSVSMEEARQQVDELVDKLEPDYLRSKLLWLVLFIPTWILLVLLLTLKRVDQLRYLGIIRRRTFPAIDPQILPRPDRSQIAPAEGNTLIQRK